MLSVQDHPIVQQIDNEITQQEVSLASLQTKRITITKSLLQATYGYAPLICQNLNIQPKDRGVALLCGYEFLTNIQMVEQWLLEQLVELNLPKFDCSISELQNRLLRELRCLQQDAIYF